MFLDAMDFFDGKNGIVIGDPIDNKIFLAKTMDGGNTWNQLTVNPPLDILSLTVSSSDPQKVWITQSHYTSPNRVWQTTDGGSTWFDYSGTIPAIPVNCIVYQNGSNDGLYIGTDLGVFYSRW